MDIQGYFCILAILLFGFSVAFTVSMPGNEHFAGDSSTGVAGLAGLLTTFQAIVGNYDMEHYENTESQVSPSNPLATCALLSTAALYYYLLSASNYHYNTCSQN